MRLPLCMETEPESGFIIPAAVFKSVDFPLPFAPDKAIREVSEILRLIFLSTSLSPNAVEIEAR